MEEESPTLTHFKAEVLKTLAKIVDGEIASARCGMYTIERTAWHIEMSPSFARQVLVLARPSGQDGA